METLLSITMKPPMPLSTSEQAIMILISYPLSSVLKPFLSCPPGASRCKCVFSIHQSSGLSGWAPGIPPMDLHVGLGFFRRHLIALTVFIALSFIHCITFHLFYLVKIVHFRMQHVSTKCASSLERGFTPLKGSIFFGPKTVFIPPSFLKTIFFPLSRTHRFLTTVVPFLP
jgi:hypothetical protein